jgi:hypothetical protein
MTSSYRGYARASENLNSGKVIDPSQKILQRNKEFLEDFRRVQEFERMQESDAFQQYQKNTETQTNSQVDAAKLQANYGKLVNDQQQENVRKKQEAMRLSMERDSKQPSGWDKTLNTFKQLEDFSQTVSKLYGDYKKAEEEAKVEKERRSSSENTAAAQRKILGLEGTGTVGAPVTQQSLFGSQEQRSASRRIAADGTALSSVQEQQGDIASAYATRKNADLNLQPTLSVAEMSLRVKSGFTNKIANFNGKIGNKNFQDLTIDEKIQSATDIKGAVLLELGYNLNNMDPNVAFIIDNLAAEKIEQYLGTETTNALSAAKANSVDAARTIFREDPSGINVQGLYVSLHQQNNGDDKKARDDLFDEFKSFNYDTEDVDLFLNSKVPGLPKSWKEQFPGDAQQLINARSTTGIQNAEALDNEREIADIERANAIREGAITDLEDGVYNSASGEEIAEKIKYYSGLGDTETVDALTKMLPYTASAQHDARVEEQFNELLVNGVQGDLTPDMVLTSGLSNKKKTEWLSKVKAFDATAPSETSVNRAKDYISDSLKGRAQFNEFTGKIKDPSLNRAIDSAMDQYQSDYKQAMLQDGMSPGKAAEYALGRFQKEFGDNEYAGIYRVGDPKTGLPDNVARSFIDNSFTVKETNGDYDYNKATLNRALTVPNAIDQPGLINYDLLKNVSVQTLTKKGMPASIQHVAARSNKPAFEILNRQLKANKLTPIPEAVYTAANEAQNVVTGDLQVLLNKYPTPTRTDIAMIGSGQQAIYTQLQPTQRRGLNILAKYESGNLGYDAMNEAGSDEGRTAHGSGSSVIKLGKSFTKMTIAEVMEHQAAGRLHAAGRYQFIASTLAEQVQKLGIPPTALFNEEMQDYMASEYAKQVGWRGIWIGPTDNATPQEQAVLDAMSAADVPGVPPWRQARNMNPSVVAMTVRTKEQGPGSGYWNWDEQRNLWVKGNAN